MDEKTTTNQEETINEDTKDQDQFDQDGPERDIPEELIHINQDEQTFAGVLTQAAIRHLKDTAPWTRFFSILGFIVCGLMVIASLAMLIGFGAFGERSMVGTGIAAFFFYLIFAVVIFFPNLYLNKFSRHVSNFCDSTDRDNLEAALEMQKKYWNYMGVLAIIYLSILVLVLIGTIFSGIMN
jgi:hypothetical protein